MVCGVCEREREREDECSLMINNTMKTDKGIHGLKG